MDERVLVVCGDRQFRRAVEVALASQNYAVDLAQDSAAAGRLAEKTPPLVLITDQQADGLQLARQLRARIPHLRCLSVTDGRAAPNAATDRLAEWVYPFRLPFSMVRFVAVVHDAMRLAGKDLRPDSPAPGVRN